MNIALSGMKFCPSPCLKHHDAKQHKGFMRMLKMAVFGTDRPWASHIASIEFLITSTKIGLQISSYNWAQSIKSGAHIRQAMIIPTGLLELEYCSRRGCDGLLAGELKTWYVLFYLPLARGYSQKQYRM
jgi:hypothetical protein